MATHKLLLLPGDGIGPEVMAEVKKLIAWMNAHGMGTFETEEGLVGGSCYDAHQVSITDATMAQGARRRRRASSARSAGRSGTRCPMTCGRKRACCGCARTSRSTPTSAPR